MEDDVFGARHGLEGPLDQVGPGLDQHLDGHVVGDVTALDEGAEELELRLGSGGKAHLDLLHADVYQGVEEFQLFFHVHGVDEGLIAVPQVHGAPDGRSGNLLVGPGPALHLDGNEGDVLFSGIFEHGKQPPVFLSGREGCKNAPDRCYGQGRMIRGTTLIRPPVTRTALVSLQQGFGR